MNSEERKLSSGLGIATRESCGQRNNHRPGGSGVVSLLELVSRIMASEHLCPVVLSTSWTLLSLSHQVHPFRTLNLLLIIWGEEE